MLRYPRLLALAAGALSATGFAPLELWPVTLACFSLLIWLVETAPNARGAFARTWLFGLGHFTVGLNWIAHAFTYQDAMPHWFGYSAVVALSLYLAVFPAVAGCAARLFFSPLPARGEGGERSETEEGQSDRTAPLPGRSATVPLPNGERVSGFTLFFAALWIATEWLRATLFTGFAWNPLAAIWVPTAFKGFAAVMGTYGLSGFTILIAGSLLQFAVQRSWRAALGPGIFLLVLLKPQWTHDRLTDQHIRIVQPNVSQDEKNDPATQAQHIREIVALSGQPTGQPRILLWPEAAIDNGYLLEEEPGLRRYLMKAVGRNDVLLTGGIALEYDKAGRAIGGRNSVFALGPDSRIAARYDKAHLVPYGEYLPMRTILTPLGLSRLVPGDLDFWPGPGPRTFDIPGIGPVGFQICYEIIFSGQVVDPRHRPRFIFNPSNDAWFGSWGPPQHLAQARLRAVEEGMTIVRATPTGISAVIGPDGALLASIGQHKAGVVDAGLPEPRSPTWFALWGNLLPAIVALLLTALAVVIRLRRR